MAEHGKFCSIAETKLLLDMWSQDHIQKQLKAAARMLCLEDHRGSGKVGVLYSNVVRRQKVASYNALLPLERLFCRSLSQTSQNTEPSRPS